MFKKPLSELKTSAPLRGSDRRKLKQRVVSAFSLQPEDGDLLVPEGLLSQKFSTHVNEPGVAYFSQEGDPLWFTIGKGSDDLIPTIYTLWKRPDLMPFLSTPAPVIPKLIGGADLMIPGVVQHTPPLVTGQLVSITQYHRDKLGPPLAVGQMAVSSGTLDQAEEKDVKGKAAFVLHTWKDSLWDMGTGKKMEPPEPREMGPSADADTDLPNSNPAEQAEEAEGVSEDEAVRTDEDKVPEGLAQGPSTQANAKPPEAPGQNEIPPALTAEDISSCLRSALLQALATTLFSLQPSSFPIPASTFWTTYVLPARPAHPLGIQSSTDASAIDIKHSTHKSVKAFLKACAKEGLIKLKETKGDVVVVAVYPTHLAVASHRPHRTIQSIDAKREKAEERERKEKEAEEKKKGEIQVTELWKPHGHTVPWFVAAEKDTSSLYSLADLKETFNNYVSSRQLINAQDQQYINVGDDSALLAAVSVKGEEKPEFLKREDSLRRIRENMQSWYDVKVEGSDAIRKKGHLRPISVVVKIRQGRKAATLTTGFEAFLLDADSLADELRKACASSTSVAPVHGRASEMEVMVQGKQVKTVVDLLIAKGVPKKWIETADLSAEKKKK